MIAAFIAASIGAYSPYSLTPPPPVRADARPALWVVNDQDTIIYLFGTFHSLDSSADWFNSEVRTALGQSEMLVLETLPPGPSTDPSPEKAAPPPTGGSDMMQSARAVMDAGRTRGMSTKYGADMVLRQAAEFSGKPVAGLENFQAQVGMIQQLSGNPQPVDPAQAAKMSAALAAVLADLQSAWSRGSADRFDTMLEEMRLRSPQTYQTMFADRNARWADWIAHRLQQPGTVFVAVGAGHLAGRDSVQIKLAQAGYRTARVN